MNISFQIGDKAFSLSLPDAVTILRMNGAKPLENPREKLIQSMNNPIASKSIRDIAKQKLDDNPKAQAVIAISDNTRPVPYIGEEGILLPLVRELILAGISPERITILCANGTHLPLSDAIFRKMLDPEIFRLGISVINHDCLDEDNLVYLGRTSKGTEIKINKAYMNADLKILTGLVESHFMAGVSGGRKSICPGLISERGTYIFHSVDFLEDENAKDLQLENNPLHNEALEVARIAGADFIVNVTLNESFQVTGYYAGDMEKAHMEAYEKVVGSVAIQCPEKYDIVLTHAGFVGKNHYQAAKAANAALPLLHENSYLVMALDCTDPDPIGKSTYRMVLPYLKNLEADNFIALLKDSSWKFIPDQWQVQMWAKLFKVIRKDHFYFYAPQITKTDYSILPGMDGNIFLDPEERYGAEGESTIPRFLEKALEKIKDILYLKGIANPKTAWLSDGPYGIVVADS